MGVMHVEMLLISHYKLHKIDDFLQRNDIIF